MNNQSRNWKDKRVAVLGLGIEGLSSAGFLVQRGTRVTVLDQKTENELAEVIGSKEIKKLRNQGVMFQLGNVYLKGLDKYDVMMRSPGIKRDIPELIKAEQKGSIVTSQTKLFFEECPCPIVGVTGTKGKGTTSALIYEMLRREGINAYLGGNIGKPPLDFLDILTPQSLVVLELSSYQLQDLTKSPHIAVVLMITREHLASDRGGEHENYHSDIADYVSAKRNILRFQTASDAAILNRDYSTTRESDMHTEAKVYYVSTEKEVEEGCFVKDGKVVVSLARGPAPRLLEIIDVKDILLPGRHNLENVCAAAMAASIAGASKSSIVSVLRTFKGLEHRLQLVGEVNGVKYYDDSFSTTPETAIAAIQAFTQPEILILGGAHKGSDFTQLGRVISISKNIKAIIGIGIEWPKIKERIINYESFNKAQDRSGIRVIEGYKNMREIVGAAAEIAEPGDVVLLSPACSSFDMFKNYKERGEQFKREVASLSKS